MASHAFVACAIAGAWAICVAWLIGRAARQYRSYESLAPLPVRSPTPAVTVIVPARNEAGTIRRCLAGLTAQDYPVGALRIVVVDDGSSDDTAVLVREAAKSDPRIELIAAAAPPPGWFGKPAACHAGALLADSPWLCFIDADTSAGPALLRSAVAMAEERGIDLLSLEPRQELVKAWERLIISAGLCALGFAGELRRGSSVNGQFILVRRPVYERAGGHAAVRAEVAEDSALARRVKAVGGRIHLMDGSRLFSVRMYRNLPELWEGLTKNVTETFGGTARTAFVTGAGVLLAWSAVAVPACLARVVLPSALTPLAVAAVLVASLASVALLGLHIAAARYLNIPRWYGVLFPIGYTAAALLALAGIAARWRGQVTWRGRIYSVAGKRPSEIAGDD